ncbi:MAG: RNA methyltransferase [Actinobacteria bacterium]|nr:RNA methyltransferase [Actinomycetota bacterium]
MITSASNPRLRLVRRLASSGQRERLGLFSCEGEDLIRAALEAGLEPVDLLVDGERPPDGLPPGGEVEPGLLAELSVLGHPPRAIGVFRREDLPRLESPDAPPVGLALWKVADPGNIGTLLRAADGLGPASVALSPGCADPTSPKALRASAGAIFRVPLGRFDDAGARRIALVAQGETPLESVELPARTTFVLGAERQGLPDDVLAGCDERATIPLSPASESLNVAIAGSIALYEWSRRHR